MLQVSFSHPSNRDQQELRKADCNCGFQNRTDFVAHLFLTDEQTLEHTIFRSSWEAFNLCSRVRSAQRVISERTRSTVGRWKVSRLIGYCVFRYHAAVFLSCCAKCWTQQLFANSNAFCSFLLNCKSNCILQLVSHNWTCFACCFVELSLTTIQKSKQQRWFLGETFS